MPEVHPFISNKWLANLMPPPTENWFMGEHSFGYIPTTKTKSIFLGTFPTYDVVNHIIAGNLEFYYGAENNNFWPILRKVTDLPLATEQEIFNFLNLQTEFGITDILKKVDRDGYGNADSDLTPITYNNLVDLHENFSCISNIYVTSGGRGQINPISASGWLRTQIENQGYTTQGFDEVGYQKIITINLHNQPVWKFKLISLFSPSNAANPAIQGKINAIPLFAELVNNLPADFINENMPNKGRIVQWAYLLYLNHFPVQDNLRNFINANQESLSRLFW